MTEKSLIRPARDDECALLTALALRAKAIWGYSDQFMADCVAELTISETDIRTQQFFVLESVSEVIGFCALLEGGEREHGWQSLLVVSDPNATEFYLSSGGTQIGTVP